ncbi:hypothetical protein P4119_20830 [Pseudomonas aeruginosa]|nr:hypothetical protein [Pseudomonas aeruginosa]
MIPLESLHQEPTSAPPASWVIPLESLCQGSTSVSAARWVFRAETLRQSEASPLTRNSNNVLEHGPFLFGRSRSFCTFTDAWNDRELRLLLMLIVFGYSVTVLTITVEMYRFEMAEKAMWGALCNKANYMNCQPDYQR